MSQLPSLFEQTMARLYGAVPQQPLVQPRIPGGPSPIQPLNPQDEASLLDKIGGAALGGLGYVGGSLGKAFGGRAIRGALGGQLDELASIIPFSDTLGITDPSHEVTGAQLLGNRDADLLSPEGLGGMALEIGLDPATYLSFGAGALTKLGQTAKATGVLPKTTAARLAGLAAGSPEADTLARAVAGTLGQVGPVAPEQLAAVTGQRLGGHVGIGLPFAGNAATADLRPAAAGLNQMLGNIPGYQTAQNLGGAAVELAQPAVRGFRALFDKSVQGMTDPLLQKVMAEKYSAQLPNILTQTRRDVRPLVELAQQGNLLTEPGGRLLGDVVEGAAQAGTPIEQQIGSQIGSLMQQLQGEQANALLPVRNLTPQTILSGQGAGQPMQYAPRQLAREEFAGKGPRPRILAPTAQQARVEATEGLTRSRLAELAKDDFSGMSPALMEDKIRTDYLGLPPNAPAHVGALRQQLAAERQAVADAQQTITAADVMKGRGPLDPSLANDAAAAALAAQQAEPRIKVLTDQVAEMEARMAQAKDLARYKLEDKVPVFNHPIEDVANKVFKDRERALKADAFHTAVAGMAVPQAEAGPGAISFLDALQRGGLAPEGNRLMQKTQDALQYLGKAPAALEDLWLKPEDLKPLMRWLEGTRTPAGLQPFIQAWDSITNLTKAWQTAAWPANWARNFISDQFMHWTMDGSAPGQLLKDLVDAKAIHEGASILDAHQIPILSRLSPADASTELHRMIVDHGVTGQGRILADVLGETGEGMRLQGLIPQQQRPGLMAGYAQAFGEGSWNPFGVRGVGGRTEDTNKFISAGRNVNENLYDISRIQTFVGKLRQGFTPEEAAREVVRAHYDMGNLSGFERDFVRRVVPFYGWARQNIPTILTEIANEPGGKTGVALKVAGRARGAEPGFLPPQIGEGLALPVGTEDNGTQRFFGHLGLPFEDLGQLVTKKDYLGLLNPLIKAPLELATGKQFFTGRDLRDLRSETGSTLLDQLIMNSPAGRVMTTGRTLADERKDAFTKAINLLSGAHLTDVNMEQARDTATRNYIADQLAGSPNIGQHLDLFAKPQQLQNLTPTELLMLRLQATRDKERRQQQQVGVAR